MNKYVLVLALLGVIPSLVSAQSAKDEQALIDSINNSFTFQQGVITLKNGMAKLTVPKGFKFLDSEQSTRVLVELWGNPPGQQTEGMLFPEAGGPLADKSFAFNVTYDDMGYVKDEDADEIDYDDLLTEMKESISEESAERKKQGYESINLIGWASPPFYDKESKVLHWAKEIQFGDTTDHHTLNYDVRVLGRKGVISLNAIAGLDELNQVKGNIPGILGSVAFEEGNRYADFDGGLDKVAAVGIGGLVAGKVLAKVGFFALALKFWKVILIGIAALGSFARKLFTGRSKEVVNTEAEG